MASVVRNVFKHVVEIENTLINNILQRFLQGQLAPAFLEIPKITDSEPRFSLKNLLQQSILWAVPKKRRSIQKVRNRRFGVPKYFWKPLVKKELLICRYCRGAYEPDTLCRTCYNKVMEETKLIQKKIEEELNIAPVEENVIVLYENERNQHDPEFYKGKRIVELPKPRPSFFSQNLLQRSTQPNAKSSEVVEVPHRLEFK